MKKYGFVYIWRDRKHNRYYIGSHWGSTEDGYICSSKWMKKSFKRRPEDFKRRIIETDITDVKYTRSREYYWLQLIDSSQLGKKYYNRSTMTSILYLDGTVKSLARPKGYKQSEKWIDRKAESRSRLWKIQFPDGKIEDVQNLKKFCRDHDIDYRNMHRLKYKTTRNRTVCQGYRLLEKIT